MLVTGTDSAVLSGQKAQLLASKRESSIHDRTIYTRLPDSIEVYVVNRSRLNTVSGKPSPPPAGAGVGKLRGKMAQGRRCLDDRGRNLPHAGLISFISNLQLESAVFGRQGPEVPIAGWDRTSAGTERRLVAPVWAVDLNPPQEPTLAALRSAVETGRFIHTTSDAALWVDGAPTACRILTGKLPSSQNLDVMVGLIHRLRAARRAA